MTVAVVTAPGEAAFGIALDAGIYPPTTPVPEEMADLVLFVAGEGRAADLTGGTLVAAWGVAFR